MSDNTFVKVEKLNRVFDVSKPFLNRIIEKQPRRFVNAVTDVNFTIGKGETFALVGESGSGKSTVAKMVVGLLPPTSGRVEIDGIPITAHHDRAELRQLRRRMQMIFQDPYASLNPRWRVGRIIAEPMLALSVVGSKSEAQEEVRRLLALVGLSPADDRKFPHEFSGGQRQRIAIARALASKCEFIVCDEPTSALDVSVQAQILNLMRDLQEQLGLTYLLISHNLAVVRHMANRIGVMHFGKLVEVQDARALFKQPGHEYTQMLIKAVPDISMAGREKA
jgi:peptide/nickel transport system ATP-binding protein